MKVKILLVIISFLFFITGFAQERIVKIDFESGTFVNNPKIPFDQPFGIVGEASKDVEFVKVNILFTDKTFVLHSFHWNRIDANKSENFNIVVPAILRSNTKYDFEVITYKLLTASQKNELLKNVEDRVRFLLANSLYFDGKNVQVNKPKRVYEQLAELLQVSFQYHESKNLIALQAPSQLVLEELKKQNDFKFGRFFKKSTRNEVNEIANTLINEKIEHLVALISSEISPYVNSQIVQHYRKVYVRSVETDKEPFSLPVNFGMYAWNKTVNIDNTETQNIDFTPGVGITIPFSSKSKFASRNRVFDSFGLSAGVLLRPISDVNDTKFVTPGVDLPVFVGLGFRMFKVVRFNMGVLTLGEKGTQNFNNLTFIPTAGLALELNLWMGIKK